MKKTNLTIFLCLFSMVIFAQEIVSTSGGQPENSTAQMSWTIGEPITETVVEGDYGLTQGFHQTYLEVTAIDEIQRPGFSISAFPNPATEYVELLIERESKEALAYQLFDLNGKLLLDGQIQNNKVTISTMDLLPATYFINIKEGQNVIQTFQIIKK